MYDGWVCRNTKFVKLYLGKVMLAYLNISVYITKSLVANSCFLIYLFIGHEDESCTTIIESKQ